MNYIKKECLSVVGHRTGTKRLNNRSIAQIKRKVKRNLWMMGAVFTALLAMWFVAAWIESLNFEWWLPVGVCCWMAKMCYECAGE